MSLNTEKRSVLQDWTFEISFMQQSVLLTAVRGPDGIAKYHPVKYLLRWYRRCILLSSFWGRVVPNPYDSDGGSFLGASIEVAEMLVENGEKYDWRPMMDDLVGDYLRAADELPHHWQMHFMHAVEIVGYKHPDPEIRAWWSQVYGRLVADMHLFPESEEQLDRRLGDRRETWLERCDEALVK